MKKNKMMRLASVMLVATLMTTSMISGTFAKYVTEGTGQDSARVATWGVNIVATGTTFANEYKTHDADVKGTITESVVSNYDTDAVENTNDNLVAPGTSGNMAAVTITGQPEVAVKVSYNADLKLSENWKDSEGNYYCPIKINVLGTVLDGSTYESAAAFEAAVEGLIAGYSKNYEANTDLSTVSGEYIGISWEWPFEVGTTEDEIAANDAKDTYLGNQAAAGNAVTIGLTVTTTVTQID